LLVRPGGLHPCQQQGTTAKRNRASKAHRGADRGGEGRWGSGEGDVDFLCFVVCRTSLLLGSSTRTCTAVAPGMEVGVGWLLVGAGGM
jgi:hypothetical protein